MAVTPTRNAAGADATAPSRPGTVEALWRSTNWAQLAAEAVEHALGSVQLPGYVLGVVADRPVRAAERHVRDVRPQHVRLDERFDPVPDLLAVTVEVERVRHQVEAVIARARTLPVDDPS